MLGFEPKALHMLGKPPSDWTTPLATNRNLLKDLKKLKKK